MYACMYAFMYVWMYGCMYVCMYGCMYVCMYVHIHAYAYIQTYIQCHIISLQVFVFDKKGAPTALVDLGIILLPPHQFKCSKFLPAPSNKKKLNSC